MVEKLTSNYLATALVDIHEVSMPIAYSPICVIVLSDRTAHFKVAFYCPQRKLHLVSGCEAGWMYCQNL